MKFNKAKERMLDGKAALGIEICLGSPLAAELISPMGFDYIVVDTQHGSWSEDTTMQAFRAIALGSAVPMARARSNDFGLIGRLLDVGALGIIGPMVNSAEDAEKAAFAVRYPPSGGRSGGEFGTGFYGNDYSKWANEEVFLAVQIETATGLDNADAIMSVDGVDGCWIGPHDLSKSLGLDLTNPKDKSDHNKAIGSIVDSCHRQGKISGISTQSIDMAQPWLDKGCQFVTLGGDVEWLIEGAEETLRRLGRIS